MENASACGHSASLPSLKDTFFFSLSRCEFTKYYVERNRPFDTFSSVLLSLEARHPYDRNYVPRMRFPTLIAFSLSSRSINEHIFVPSSEQHVNLDHCIQMSFGSLKPLQHARHERHIFLLLDKQSSSHVWIN
jgi:hypothetical protein